MFTLPRLLSRTKPTLTGLDISSRAIRLVELHITAKAPPVIVRHASEALPMDAINNGHIEKIDLVIQTLRDLLEKCGSTAREVAMNIPACLTTTVLLPVEQRVTKPRHTQLTVMAQQALASLVPYPIQQACIDIQLPESTQGNAHQHVLVAAVHRDCVDDRLAIAEAAGLDLLAIEPDCYAQYATCLRNPGHGLGNTANCTAQLTGILCIDGNALQLALFISPNASPRMVSLSAPLPQSQRTPDGLARLLPGLWQRSLELFATSMPSTTHNSLSEKIILTGPQLATPACQKQMQSVLPPAVEVSISMPFFGMTLIGDGDTSILKEHGSPYLTACGLALGLHRQKAAR
ncbi:Tfp pilus assembly PilM family ATPase [Herbaspirillum sp. Sphag1AN]|uniref:type IV pilus biogenesis protein PilM n=1 Tax=unclassified Herbaspirillum TaxID=2624150 RepID=UPI0016150CA9|nr:MULTISPECIES: pilus assembly protein PilM [unclassified Herbaspirillum]MBB3212592.1 Tfp pilus assembly PilM family ATPase [Herbaspirillum sp. Sphag1AN]MBB3245789.1 Tfp pilus assembly PilM family ATPase [Herbaspirillum sp. Sphag64]